MLKTASLVLLAGLFLTAGQTVLNDDANARGRRGGGGLELGPNSCFWKTRNWHCRPY